MTDTKRSPRGKRRRTARKSARDLPCPFCGQPVNDKGSVFHDDDCWLKLYYGDKQRGPHVVAAWNRRAAQPVHISGLPGMPAETRKALAALIGTAITKGLRP